jgi:hypothetical protein
MQHWTGASRATSRPLVGGERPVGWYGRAYGDVMTTAPRIACVWSMTASAPASESARCFPGLIAYPMLRTPARRAAVMSEMAAHDLILGHDRPLGRERLQRRHGPQLLVEHVQCAQAGPHGEPVVVRQPSAVARGRSIGRTLPGPERASGPTSDPSRAPAAREASRSWTSALSQLA